MRIGVNLGPTGDWAAMMTAAQIADKCGFDALGFLDHYHAEKPEWSYVCGWSAYGALALATTHIHLVPMVIDAMNYLPGVLAKESTTLATISGGRFELGIGAGDFFVEAQAWGTSVPNASARINRLKETITILRRTWQGERVTFQGEHWHLQDAAITPIPAAPLRVVVGAGSSQRLIQSAVAYADEINVYADDNLIRFAQQEIINSQRDVQLSVFVWDWLEDITTRLATWEQLGVTRTFITFWHPFDSIAEYIKYQG